MGVAAADVGKKIREFRTERKISREKLAESLDVSVQQVHKYESGKSAITIDRLETIAETLGLPLSRFFPPDVSEGLLLDAHDIELVQAFREVSDPDVKDGIRKIVLALNRRS